MATSRICPQCGATLPGHAAAWLCPKCLLGQAATPLPPEASLKPQTSTLNEPTVLHYFGDYELLREIARGGMGVVYKARQISLNRIVAVKMLLFGKLAGDDFIKRFRAEAEAAASLQHPNIVAIHEVGEHEAQQYFSMDYVEGSDLAELVRENPLSAKRAATYLKAIAEAIHYAHQRGILHRDLKPSNVLIDASDQPRVTDFGLAKRLALDPQLSTINPQLTVTGQILGTPGYMSPEQAGGRRSVLGPTSDVYSLGALLYFLVTARAPFAADSLEETLRQVHESEPVSPRLLNVNVPRDLETICLKCLNKEPHRRYTTAQALAEDLGRWLNGETIVGRPATVVEKVWTWCRRRPAVAMPLGLSLLFLLVVAVGSSIAATRINRERALAQAQAKKSQQVSQFLADTLQGIQPEVALGRDTTVLREILDRTEQRLSSELKDQPEVEADLRHTIGLAYNALDEPAKAEAMHREALRLRTAALGQLHPDTLNSQYHLAHSVHHQHRSEEFQSMMSRLLEVHIRVLGEDHVLVAEILNSLASVADSYTETELLVRRSLAILERIGVTNGPVLGRVLDGLSVNLQLQEHFAEAETFALKALAVRQQSFGEEHPTTAASFHRLASVLRESGKLDEAESAARKSWSLASNFHGVLHPITIRRLLELAQIQLDRRDQSAARPLLQQVLDAVSSWTNQIPTATVSDVMAELGFVLTEQTRQHWDQGDAERAREYALDAERVLRPLLTVPNSGVGGMDDWRLQRHRSLYAGALIAVATTDLELPLEVRLAKFAEIETLLTDIFNHLAQQSDPDAAAAYHRLAPTYERMVALYLRWNDAAPDPACSAKVSEWRQRLGELERNAGRKPGPRMSERYQPQ